VFHGRGFFGFVKVRKEYDDTTEGWYNVLIHGGIDHGRQHLDPARQRLPISYFHPTGGIGQVFQRFSWPDERLPASLVGHAVGPGPLPMGLLCDLHSEPPFSVVGLGTGTLAAHARPWQTMHIYEIDPLVRSLSLPRGDKRPIFTYVQDAKDRGADMEIIMGDGRLRLRDAPEKFYHIIVLDAFSSDAIPVHLLTADAVAEYLEKLADGGVLIFNTTNRYVDIRGVLGNIADAHKMRPLTYGDYSDDIPDKFGSDWVVLQRRDLPSNRPYTGLLPLDSLLDTKKWHEPERDPRPVWTDKYSNLLSVIHWR
jgi:SAM-dependent methyltransferase